MHSGSCGPGAAVRPTLNCLPLHAGRARAWYGLGAAPSSDCAAVCVVLTPPSVPVQFCLDEVDRALLRLLVDDPSLADEFEGRLRAESPEAWRAWSAMARSPLA